MSSRRMTLTRSGSSSSRTLLRPSPHSPWDVSVVGVVPEDLIDGLTFWSNTRGVAEGNVFAVWSKSKVHVWFSQHNLDRPPMQTMYHPTMSSSSSPWLLAIDDASCQSAQVHIYACNPATSQVYLFMVPSNPARSSRMPSTCKVRLSVPLEDGDSICVMKARQGHVWIGTTKGAVYVVVQSSQPLLLTVEGPLERTAPRSGSSLYNYVFGSSSSSLADIDTSSPIQNIVLGDDLAKESWSVSKIGTMESWKDGSGAVRASLSNLLKSSELCDTEVETVGVVETCLSSTTGGLVLLVTLNQERLYVVEVDSGLTQLNRLTWLSRFQPSVVEVVGLLHDEDETVYVVLQYAESTLVTVIALQGNSRAVSEVDLPMDTCPRWLPGTVGQDVATHGCTGITTQGLHVRARNHATATGSSSLRSTAGIPSSQQVTMLSNHLRSAFWHSYQLASSNSASSNKHHWPPSLQTADLSSVEAAIIGTAKLLQKEGTESLGNPLEWHLAYVRWLRESSHFKKLSTLTRWTLLGIGQELAVYQALHGDNSKKGLFEGLTPNTVASKLGHVQAYFMEHSPMDQGRWCDGLLSALEASRTFRSEHAGELYDVFEPYPGRRTPASPSAPILWTHSTDLQKVLRTQLDQWKKRVDAASDEQTELVVRVLLTSYQETKEEYSAIKAKAIPLIRDDHVAFDLCLEHSWYEGLCQFALTHKGDSHFNLKSLMNEDSPGRAMFILKWFTKEGYYGTVYQLGEEVPELLMELLGSNTEYAKKLKPLRWLHATNQDDYHLAADYLMEQVAGSSEEEDMSLEETEFLVSMAKLCAKCDGDYGAAAKRRKQMDSTMDLIQAQQMLLGNDSLEPLKSSSYLLEVALKATADAASTDEASNYAFVGLAVAKSMGSENQILASAARVWSATIRKDSAKFQNWIANESNSLTAIRQQVLDSTVFGKVWQMLQDSSVEYHIVQYDSADRSPIEKLVFQELMESDSTTLPKAALTRLLRSVTTIELIQAKSLAVGPIAQP